MDRAGMIPYVPSASRRAGVVELVDAPDSKSGSVRSVGSSPTTRTTLFIELMALIASGHVSLQARA
jgi:hypothetical protein